MTSPALPLDKESSRIRTMFARVAPRYDLLNHLLSGSLDRLWRRRASRSLARALPPGARILDLCCGTGDQAEALRAAGFRVVAADFCLPMLALAGPKFRRGSARPPAPLNADALELPLPDAGFDGATVSFGMRNVADLHRALVEIARVLRPGGELAVLEFTVPAWQPLRWIYLFYFRYLLPRIGAWVSGDGSAYVYLPESVLGFPQREGFLAELDRAGFVEGRFASLSGGILCLYRARRKP